MSDTRANGKKATHPCPCGYHGDKSGRCNCSAEQVQRYRSKISGPLLDRIDIQVEVPRPDRLPDAENHPRPESSAEVRRRVVEAREWQLKRNGVPNALLRGSSIRKHCSLKPTLRDFLEEAAQRMGLSPRGCQRVLKVARTVADLDAAVKISGEHLAEALAYRGIDCGNPQG